MAEGQSSYQFVGTDEQRQLIERAVPQKAPAAPKRPRKLLVVTLQVRDGQVRSRGHAAITYGNLAMELMGKRTGAFEAVFSNDTSVFRPENLKAFDAICFNNTVGVLTEDAALRQSLLDFVSNGKGIVGFHAAAATFCQYPRYDQFPQFGEMLGGFENGGHPWKQDETITIKVEDAKSPINAAFAGKGFDIKDEVFQFQDHYSREKMHVLLSIDTDKTDMNPARHFLPDRFADRDFAMSWIKRHGKGRVFYSSFGHNADLFWNSAILAALPGRHPVRPRRPGGRRCAQRKEALTAPTSYA